MKINHPITNKELKFDEHCNILSTTDLKGAISYVNPDFIEISGFSEEELVGKNHNVVRHPDMPPAAFESLWTSMKEGKPWMGIVKNRCKNGDHYWVDAYVMPIRENGGTLEYQSVRFKPDPEWVKRAEPAYKRLLAGKLFRPGLGSRLGITYKLIMGNLLALLPALIFTQADSLSQVSYIGFLLTAVAGGIVNTSFMRPFSVLTRQAREVFDNDLMSHIYTGRSDEFGAIELALKMQQSQINAIIGRLSDTMRSLDESAKTTASSAEQANHGVSMQKQEIEQVATAVTEMAATVQEIAKNASQAAESTVLGAEQTAEGQQVVDSNIESINALDDEIKRTAEVIDKLSDYSTNIVKVLDVIKSIAEQTNLLALNAAIEAARAGENGRGFAVVADEVRTLAGRTTESAREIEEMIELLQGSSKQAVIVMGQSRDMAENSVQHAARAGEALAAISQAINDITDMNHQIATASEEQSVVAAEVDQSIVNISQIAVSTAEGATQSVSATEKVVDTIEKLNKLVIQFRK